jgi:uncharacterized protein
MPPAGYARTILCGCSTSELACLTKDLPVAHRESSATTWIWQQTWSEVLFLHWRVAAADVRPHVPAALTIDTWEGDAWVSLVLFRLSVRPAWLPPVPGLSSLVEANLRTYVSLDERPGIHFLSIHANNRWAMALARLLTPLPYQQAAIDYRAGQAGCSCTLHAGREPECHLSLHATMLAPQSPTSDGSREAWLLERYRAYVPYDRSAYKAPTGGRGDVQTDVDSQHTLTNGQGFGGQGVDSPIHQAVVEHDRWCVQPVEASLQTNTLGNRFGLNLDRPPDAAHFCPQMKARFSRFYPCVEPFSRLAFNPAPRSLGPAAAPPPPQTVLHSVRGSCPSGGPTS